MNKNIFGSILTKETWKCLHWQLHSWHEHYLSFPLSFTLSYVIPPPRCKWCWQILQILPGEKEGDAVRRCSDVRMCVTVMKYSLCLPRGRIKLRIRIAGFFSSRPLIRAVSLVEWLITNECCWILIVHLTEPSRVHFLISSSGILEKVKKEICVMHIITSFSFKDISSCQNLQGGDI